MNKIQIQISEVFSFADKYEMREKDANLFKNSIQMLVHALGIIADKGLEQQLQTLMET